MAALLLAAPMSACAETTTPVGASLSEVRQIACTTLGRAEDCPAREVESFAASRIVRRLWVVGSTEARQVLVETQRSAPAVDGSAIEELEIGSVVGEDALVLIPPRRVPCGPLRPLWVDRATTVYWDDAVLIVESRVDLAEERKRKTQAEKARKDFETRPPVKRSFRERFFVVRNGVRDQTWIDPEGQVRSIEGAVPKELEGRLREHGWRQQGEPPPLPRYVRALLARHPVLEEILAIRGEDAPAPKEMASYRLEGEPWRFVLLRTDYTASLLRVPEPTRTRVWAAIQNHP